MIPKMTSNQLSMITVFVMITFLITSSICGAAATTSATPHYPAVFYFGDSTVDTGNNNHIFSLFQANHNPYGIEFPGHVATGRFSSGKLVPDFFTSSLGLKDTVPPYLDPNLSNEDVRTGVSFASGGSGYDDLTGLGQVIPMHQQIQYFQRYKHRLEQLVGTKEAKNITENALVTISAGTNDFSLNFYDIPARRLQFDINGYQNFILSRLQKNLQELYKLGLRNFIVTGLPPLGCIPLQMSVRFRSPLSWGSCLNDENNDAQAYNGKLARLLSRLQNSVRGARFEYADIYNPLLDMIQHPNKYGFDVVNRGCCGTGILEAGFLCSAYSPVCRNPEKSLFWDSIHPGQSAYSYLSQALQKDLFPKLLRHNNQN